MDRETKGKHQCRTWFGLAKKNYIGYSRSDTMIGLMKQIKKLYDPVGFPALLSTLTVTDDARWDHESI